MEVQNIRIRFLQTTFLLGIAFLFFIAFFNWRQGLKYLAFIKGGFALTLIVALWTIKRWYRATVAVVLVASLIMITAAIYAQIFSGKWVASLWYPLYVFVFSIVTNPIGGVFASIYITLATFVMLVHKYGSLSTDVHYYLVQLISSLAITSLFCIAFYETLRRYEELMKERAERDDLTGVFSRNKIFEILEMEIERAKRGRLPLSIIMFDLDDFKRINDEKGHLFGDTVLKTAARIIQENVRKIDACGRYGGDEFLVVAPQTDETGALVVAERIRQAIKSSNLNIDVSYGIAEYKPDMSLEELVSKADNNLYTYKRSKKAEETPTA